MTRYGTEIRDDTVYVENGEGLTEVGDVDDILAVVGGPAWTITYTDEEKRQHPEMDTSDEGLTVDVVDTIHAMTFGESFVKTLQAQPVEPISEDVLSPRLGLFVGRLLENLEYGVR